MEQVDEKSNYLFKDNQLQTIEFTHELIDFKKNNLNTFIQMIDEEEKAGFVKRKNRM